jgi:hypothetical protein
MTPAGTASPSFRRSANRYAPEADTPCGAARSAAPRASQASRSPRRARPATPSESRKSRLHCRGEKRPTCGRAGSVNQKAPAASATKEPGSVVRGKSNLRKRVRGRQRELRELAVQDHPADAIGRFGEPQVSVGSSGDAKRTRAAQVEARLPSMQSGGQMDRRTLMRLLPSSSRPLTSLPASH